MIIIDTSVWIEFLRDRDPQISQQVVDYLDNNLVLGVSPVFGELLQGVRNEQEEKLILEIWENIPKINEKHLFIDAGRIAFRNWIN